MDERHPSLQERFCRYHSVLRASDSENALDRLIEIGPEVIPLISDALHAETEPRVREALVHVAWQQRSADAIPLLARALEDPEPRVWKEAIDGLVALGSPEARKVLQAAREVRPDRPTEGRVSFREWIDDAVKQIDQRTA